MLYFIAVWILLLLVCGIIGAGTLRMFKIDCFDRLDDRWILSEWVGMVVLSIVLLGVSIGLPVNSIVGVGVMLGLCTLSCASKQARREVRQWINHLSRQKMISGLALAVVIAAITSREVTWLDAGLYHYSSIQWLNQFGTVPGLALLFENLGFTSAWFALAAPFNPGMLEARVSGVGNGFAYGLAILHFWICLNHWRAGRARVSDRFMIVFSGGMLLMTLLFSVSRTILISPSPDLPVSLLVGVTAWAILAELPASSFSVSDVPASEIPLNRAIAPILLATGTVSFKLVGLPLLLAVGLYFVVTHRSHPHRWFVGGGIVALILFPFLVVNVLTSGCLLYPSTAVCFDLPWTQDPATLQSVAVDTHRWTAWYGIPPEGAHPWLWAIWQWFNDGNSHRAMALLMGLSILLSGYVGKVAWCYRGYDLLWPAVISGIGIPFFMLTSPLFRFIFPYLLLTPSLASALYWMNRSLRQGDGWILSQSKGLKLGLPLHSFVCLSLATLITLGNVRSDFSRLLIPPPMQRVPVEPAQVNDIPYFLPLEEELCWATDIPCAYGVKNDITFRDSTKGMRAGFVHRTN